ncbi:MAG: DUF1127 domain-containing protein [Rhodospirillaceae bacterium]|jgi:uncharacterized protein YjiS (DUF1127 family)|nr:DUF1127 domain-containing protein [Rhodospirillaceae bacterium]
MFASNAGQKAQVDVISHLHPCGPAIPAKPGFNLGAWFRGLIEALRKNARARADRARLMAMDDRQLDDIGLTRGDIENVINGTYNYTSRSVVQKPTSVEVETVHADDHKLAA